MALVGGADEAETLAPTGLRLLVIDASASSRAALCALLKQCSYEVRTRTGCTPTRGPGATQ